MRADPKKGKTQQILATKLADQMERQGVAAEVAARKAAEKSGHVLKGIFYMVLGVLVLLVSLALPVLVLVLTNTVPGLVLLGASGTGLFLSVYLIFSGGNIASGEGMDAAKEMEGLFGIFAKGVGLLRGKK